MNNKLLFSTVFLSVVFLNNDRLSFARSYEDPPVIDIGSNHGENDEQKNPKAPARRVILCEYQSETATLDFTFLANLGTAVITVTNLNTSQVWTITADTAGGFAVLPISGDAGYHYIHIQVSGGSTYSGSFTL